MLLCVLLGFAICLFLLYGRVDQIHQRVCRGENSLVIGMQQNNSRVSKLLGASQLEDPMPLVMLANPKRCNITELNTAGIDQKLCVPMKTVRGNTTICVYPVDVDRFVSLTLVKKGQWEAVESAGFQKLLLENPHMNVIDIGANVGVYTLLGAKLNRRVVAVEANGENIRKIHKSLQLNGFENLVTVVYNAVSDRYEQLQVDLDELHNIGGGHTKPIGTSAPGHSRVDTVSTIFLDDLLEIVTFKQAILKIDIEQYEPKAFRHASKLFKNVDIKYVFMEWRTDNNLLEDYKKVIYSFFDSRGYGAFGDPKFNSKLGTDCAKWPYDIFWKKVGS
jgi:FkbM family methyltransferase